MSAIKYKDAISTLRSIQNELRRAFAKSKSTHDDPSVEHILKILKDNQVTEKRFCRPDDHYKYFADLYLTYLRSTRLQLELTNKYYNKAERSIESSAKLVGLELPKKSNQ